MIDYAHLRDKKIAFRIRGMQRAFLGTVKLVENDGLWIQSGDLLAEAQTYGTSGLLADFRAPIVFIPTTSLLFLVAAEE